MINSNIALFVSNWYSAMHNIAIQKAGEKGWWFAQKRPTALLLVILALEGKNCILKWIVYWSGESITEYSTWIEIEYMSMFTTVVVSFYPNPQYTKWILLLLCAYVNIFDVVSHFNTLNNCAFNATMTKMSSILREYCTFH